MGSPAPPDYSTGAMPRARRISRWRIGQPRPSDAAMDNRIGPVRNFCSLENIPAPAREIRRRSFSVQFM